MAGESGTQTLSARGFYGIIAVSTMLGLGLVLIHIDPIKVLFYSAIINGVTAASVMVLIMVMTSQRRVMGNSPYAAD